ncbi:ABC transporter ATP-binding protein [Candidatus Woesebacteria bacterium]|nr:ABC transporter ATP-binding protein [Candidatus Woesebacteria bacterium]
MPKKQQKVELVIRLSNISKIYKVSEVETVALDSVSFEVKRGEYVAIMGPSGSGKSTLMHIIGALDKPTSGTYLLDGMDVASMSKDELAEIRNIHIGFVFQAYNLLARTSALKNVMLPMRYGEVPKEEATTRATKYLELVGLGDRLEHLTNQLSGGQQQRVAIARALSMDPAIILADEPTGNIASNQAEEIMQIFNDLNKRGHTIVMITHEPDIAAYARRVITIRDGRLVSDKRRSR